MSLTDLLNRETVQMALVIGLALFAHYYFIRKRMLESSVPEPPPPQLEMPPVDGNDAFDDDLLME